MPRQAIASPASPVPTPRPSANNAGFHAGSRPRLRQHLLIASANCIQNTKMALAMLNVRVRDRVRDEVRDRIVGGRLKGGEHLEEASLAAALGVSRTPLREALFALAEEGLVISRPHRGFVVAPADRQAVRDLYPILGSLEALAVEISGEALRADVPALREINARLQASPRARAANADRAFHAAPRRRCPNSRLVEMLERHEALAHRLDGAVRRGM